MNLYAAMQRKLFGGPMMLREEASEALLLQLLGEPDQAVALNVTDLQPEQDTLPYQIAEGVAIIPITGVLVQQSDWWTSLFGMTGYDTIRASMRQAVADPDVRAIVLHIDSPGGMVSGCFDTADMIFALRGTKPIWAILDDGAYSAAYLLASAADCIVAPRAGGAGSIGVITMRPDISRMLDTAGITVNLIHFGDAKVDSYPYEPLAADAHKRIQADVDTLGEMFVATVAAHRNIDPKAVRATQAACYLSDAALQAGLIDAVATPDDAFDALLDSLT